MKAQPVEDNAQALAHLIDDIERRKAGKLPRKRAAKAPAEGRDVVVREYSGAPLRAASRPSTASTTKEARRGFPWGRVVLGTLGAVLVLVGVLSYPLQTIAACAVLAVLFVPVVVIRQR